MRLNTINENICMTGTTNDYRHVGLTDEQVRKSRTEYGVNLLTPPKRPSLWKLYLEKFEDPVVRVLLVAAFFSLVISIIENEYAVSLQPFCWPLVSVFSLSMMPIRSSIC